MLEIERWETDRDLNTNRKPEKDLTEKMKRYPELQPAIPATLLRLSRTSRVLTPGIVLVTVLVLALTSIAGTVITAAVFSSKSPHTVSTSAAQAFVLITVSSPIEMFKVLG